MSDLLQNVDGAYQLLNNSWKVIRKTKNQRSITRLAKESIMQFPLVFSDGMPFDRSPIIVKGLEAMLASQVVSHLSLHNDIDLGEYDGIGGYLQKFTNTSAIPDSLMYGKNTFDTMKTFVKESAVLTSNPKGKVDPAAVYECWLDADNVVCEGSLNDIYQPYKDTMKVIESEVVRLNDLMIAQEVNTQAIKDYYGNQLSSTDSNFNTKANIHAVTRAHKKAISDYEDSFNPMVKVGKVTYTFDQMDELIKKETDPTTRDYYIKRKKQAEKEFEKMKKGDRTLRDLRATTPNVHYGSPKVVTRGEAFMEPTMVECEFLLHGQKEGRVSQKVAFGVKVMPRTIPTGAMVNNLLNTLGTSNPVFTFIKWQKGELKLVKDLLLGMNEAKLDAKANKTAARVFSSLKSLRRKAKMVGVTGKAIPVTTTFIITSLEAEQIKQQSGYNLYDEGTAAIILDKLHCMGFGIYDVENERLDILFDGYSDFLSVTPNALKKMTSDQTKDIIAEFNKLQAMQLRR